MPRLVVCQGIQYDADNLPPHVDASTCLPADRWFAENRVTERTPARAADPDSPVVTAPNARRSRATRARKN